MTRSFIIPVIDFSPASKYNIKTLLEDLKNIEGEVIVIFNSPEVAGELMHHSRIDHFAIMKKNIGVARAWNIGLDISRTEISFVLNSDLKIQEEAVNKLEWNLLNLHKAAIVGVQGSFFHFESLADIQYFDKGSFQKPISVDAVSGFFFATKTELFHNKILKFENKFTPCYNEEWDLGFQVKEFGLNSYIVPTTNYLHSWSGSIRSMKTVKYYDSENTFDEIATRNKQIFIHKWQIRFKNNPELKLSRFIDWALPKVDDITNNKDYKFAHQILALIIQFYPNTIDAWMKLGNLYQFQSNFLKAKECYQKGLELDPLRSDLKSKVSQIQSLL